MQLTLHTDYSLRVLIYLAQKGDSLSTISEVASFYAISRNHLVKVVHHLAGANFIQTLRGKNGGMRLARAPEEISVGDVVRQMEPNFDIVECFNAGKSTDNRSCAVASICALKNVLQKASREFLSLLDGYSLADAVAGGRQAEIVFPLEQFKRVR